MYICIYAKTNVAAPALASDRAEPTVPDKEICTCGPLFRLCLTCNPSGIRGRSSLHLLLQCPGATRRSLPATPLVIIAAFQISRALTRFARSASCSRPCCMRAWPLLTTLARPLTYIAASSKVRPSSRLAAAYVIFCSSHEVPRACAR